MSYTTTKTSKESLLPPPPQAAITSTWQQLVIAAGSAAGSTTAVISEESMKCLKYSVNWLQYALSQLGHQMKLLKSFLVSLATGQQHKEQPILLGTIKRDMVTTLRKAVDVITCYASNALPYYTKAIIRGTILDLPNRWAALCNDDTNNDTMQEQMEYDTSRQKDVALRLLAFGQESSDMLSSIHAILEETIQRAENWLRQLNLLNPMAASYTSSTLTESEVNDLLLPSVQSLCISASPTEDDTAQ